MGGVVSEGVSRVSIGGRGGEDAAGGCEGGGEVGEAGVGALLRFKKFISDGGGVGQRGLAGNGDGVRAG